MRIKTLSIVFCVTFAAGMQNAVAQDYASTTSSGDGSPPAQCELPQGINEVLLIETANSFVGQCLTDLAVGFDTFVDDDFSAVDLSGYTHVFVAMDGGAVEDASVANVADFANAGGALHFLGGSNSTPYATALDTHLLGNDTSNHSWATVAGSPDVTVTDSGHYLATGLPLTYDFVNNNATFYQTRVTDGAVFVAALNGDGFLSLLSKNIGSGIFDILINSPRSDYWTNGADYDWGCQVVDNMLSAEGVTPPARATFLVNKTFDDGNTAEVEVTLSCNTGLPLEQSIDISEGDGVNFVVVDFNDGEMDCTVTETAGADGYSVSYFDGTTASPDGCNFADVGHGNAFSCRIDNSLEEVEVEVTKVWIDENPQFNAQNVAGATWSCSNVAFPCELGFANGCDGGNLDFFGNPGEDSFFVFPDWESGTSCSITEVNLLESGIEVDDSECQGLVVFPGGGASCTIFNTRLFEGIPTLSQYGLGLLALLMLSVGLVGFRRFV